MRNAQNINPDNVFPRRNQVDDEAEKWGRTVEDRIVALEKAALGSRASANGLNRNIAGTSANLADQIIQLQEQQVRIQQTTTSKIIPVTVGTVNGWGDQVLVAEKPAWANYAFVSVIGTYASGSVTGIYYTSFRVRNSPITTQSPPTRAVGSYVSAGASFAPVEDSVVPAMFNVSGSDGIYFRPTFDITYSPGTGAVTADVGVSIIWAE